MLSYRPEVVRARHVKGYVIELEFDDGHIGYADLEGELWGPAFEPLRDPAVFPTFEIDPEWHTLVWPNGSDLAPEMLYRKAGGPLLDRAAAMQLASQRRRAAELTGREEQ